MENLNLFNTEVLRSRTPKEKNLIATLILAAGLLAGSLSVDMVQLFTGSGFSSHVIRDHTVLETGGKTWVAYTEPRVPLQVITDETCADCNPDEALVWLRRIVPTIDAERVDASSFEGQKLITLYGLKTLPGFLFGKNIEKADFFTEAAPLFHEMNGQYVFDMNRLGLPVGKYLTSPEISDQDIFIGNREAPVKMILFTDFECQYCKTFHAEYTKVLKEYGDRVALVVKHLPLPSHTQAETAAGAAQCANDQGKFLEYSNLLFERQSEWSKQRGSQLMKSYAYRIRGMNARDFARCLDTSKYVDKIASDIQLAQAFNLSAAPAMFIGTEFVNGSAPFEDLKSILDAALEKSGSTL